MSDYEQALKNAADRYVLFLLLEEEPPILREATQKLVAHVIEEITSIDGVLDEELASFAAERPSRVVYHRIQINRSDAEAMAKVGIVWLPQIRVVRKGRVLFRSAVQMGDNGQFLSTDVGGKSFRRTDSSLTNLIDSLDHLVK